MAEFDGCDTCSRNAAFQLSLCYSFGFGVGADAEESARWLLKSGRGLDHLTEALDVLKRMDPDLTAIQQLIELGYQSQLAQDYQNQGILEQATMQYQTLALSREHAFGLSHFATRRMRVLLSDMLNDAGRLDASLLILKEDVRSLESEYGSGHGDVLVLKGKLARTYASLGRLEESESVSLEVLEGHSETPTENFAQRVDALRDLSAVSLRRGRNEQAIERGLVAFKESEKHLGLYHNNTVVAKAILASAYSKNGETWKAMGLMEQVVDAEQRMLGAERPDTIKSLGQLHFALGNWKEAKDCFKRVLTTQGKASGQNHRSALLAASDYAAALIQTGDAKEATRILEEVLAEMAKTVGLSDIDVVNAMSNLGVAYQYEGLWQKAEPLERQVLIYRRQSHGDDHRLTLLAMRDLSDTLYRVGQWEEALSLKLEESRIREKRSETEKPEEEIFRIIMPIARLYVFLEKWDDAVRQLELEIRLRKETSTIENVEGVEAFALAATAYLSLHKLELARKRIAAFFETLMVVNALRDSFLDMLPRLGTLCEDNGLLEEAEQLFAFLILGYPERIQDFGDKVTVEKITGLMHRQGKPSNYITYDPDGLIKRQKEIDKAEILAQAR